MILHPAASVRAGRHHYPVRVYYEDTDAGGVVYHANYLRFAERARTESLRDLGVPHAEMASEHGVMFMVRRVKLDYLRPARLDDSLLVVTEPLAIRAASVDLRQGFWRLPGPGGREPNGSEPNGTEIVVVEIQLVCVRVADQRPGRLPERWRAALQALVEDRKPAQIGS